MDKRWRVVHDMPSVWKCSLRSKDINMKFQRDQAGSRLVSGSSRRPRARLRSPTSELPRTRSTNPGPVTAMTDDRIPRRASENDFWPVYRWSENLNRQCQWIGLMAGLSGISNWQVSISHAANSARSQPAAAVRIAVFLQWIGDSDYE